MLEIFKLILAYDKPKKSRKCVPDTLYKIKIEKAVTQNLGKKKKCTHTEIIFESSGFFFLTLG